MYNSTAGLAYWQVLCQKSGTIKFIDDFRCRMCMRLHEYVIIFLSVDKRQHAASDATMQMKLCNYTKSGKSSLLRSIWCAGTGTRTVHNFKLKCSKKIVWKLIQWQKQKEKSKSKWCISTTQNCHRTLLPWQVLIAEVSACAKHFERNQLQSAVCFWLAQCTTSGRLFKLKESRRKSV